MPCQIYRKSGAERLNIYVVDQDKSIKQDALLLTIFQISNSEFFLIFKDNIFVVVYILQRLLKECGQS